MAQTNGVDYANTSHLGADESRDSALRKIQTAGSITISPELFEKLYLSPQVPIKGDLRKTFGNPTPIGLAGFLMSLTPLSCDLMNWRGAQPGDGSADIAVYLFMGGILMNVAGLLEFILGNTYISVVFSTFGCFWLSFGGTLDPRFGAFSNYSPKVNDPLLGIAQPSFKAAFGFFLVFMGLLCLVYLVCSFRTNLILVGVLFPLPITFELLAASFFYGAQGNTSRSYSLKVAGGAFAFITCMFGWYLFSALMLASLDFPLQLPVFDLSTKIKGATEYAKHRHEGDKAA